MTEQNIMNWFVVHTHTGFESRVRDSILQKFREKGREEELGDVMIPSEEVVELKKGKKKSRPSNDKLLEAPLIVSG